MSPGLRSADAPVHKTTADGVRLLIRGRKSSILCPIRILAVSTLMSGLVVILGHSFTSDNPQGLLAEIGAYQRRIALAAVFLTASVFCGVLERSLAAMRPLDRPVDVDTVVDWLQAFEQHQAVQSAGRPSRRRPEPWQET